jgi:hypothetical protein
VLLEALVKETGDLSKEDLVEILENPSHANSMRLRDLILSNMQKINNLKENDPEFLELVSKVYKESQRHTSSLEGVSGNLSEVAEKIKQKGFSLSGSPKLENMGEVKPLQPPTLNSLDQWSSPEQMNQTLLDLVTENDLSELGITPSFVSALRDFTHSQNQKRKEEEKNNIKYSDLKSGLQNPKKRKGGEGGKWNLGLVSWSNDTNILTHHLAFNEMLLREDQTKSDVPQVQHTYKKGKVYRLDEHNKVRVEEEYILSNGEIFNLPVEKEDKENKEINKIADELDREEKESFKEECRELELDNGEDEK